MAFSRHASQRHDLLSERGEALLRNAEAANAKRNADDRAAEEHPRQDPFQAQPEAALQKPQNVTYQCHFLFLPFAAHYTTPNPPKELLPHFKCGNDSDTRKILPDFAKCGGNENHSLQTMNMVWQLECSPHPLLKPGQAESNQGRKSKLLLAIYALFLV